MNKRSSIILAVAAIAISIASVGLSIHNQHESDRLDAIALARRFSKIPDSGCTGPACHVYVPGEVCVGPTISGAFNCTRPR